MPFTSTAGAVVGQTRCHQVGLHGVQHMLQNRRPLGHSIDHAWGKVNVPHEVVEGTAKRLGAFFRYLTWIYMAAASKPVVQSDGPGPKALIDKLD